MVPATQKANQKRNQLPLQATNSTNMAKKPGNRTTSTTNHNSLEHTQQRPNNDANVGKTMASTMENAQRTQRDRNTKPRTKKI